MSVLVADAVADIRAYTTLLKHLAQCGQADAKSVINAIEMIDESINEIEQVAAHRPDLTTTKRIPVMTLADVIRESGQPRTRPALHVIQGDRA